jgi:hypothetical protein
VGPCTITSIHPPTEACVPQPPPVRPPSSISPPTAPAGTTHQHPTPPRRQ